MGFYSFSLPKTPPLLSKDAPISFRDIIGLNALNKLKSKSFFVFALSSFLICIPLAAYYNFAPIFVSDMGIASPAFKMSFGQMSEVLFMLMIGYYIGEKIYEIRIMGFRFFKHTEYRVT